MRVLGILAALVAVAVGFCYSLQERADARTAQAAVVGPWEGTIDVAGVSLQMRVVFREAGGILTAAIDIPQQGASGLPLREVRIDGAAVHFVLPTGAAPAVFDGTVGPDGIAGTFTQGPATGTFSLKRVVAGPPPPYREAEVTFTNGGVTLAGTLTLPPSGGPFPAVVLITGSGAQNRDEEIFGFKLFREVADHLTRQGIAVLRYDDRGVGGSTGSIATATTADFARDALAGVALLRARQDIGAARVGLLGHSEGAAAAAIAASTTGSDLAFIVMLAGSGVPGDRVTRQQVTDAARLMGATPDEVTRIVAAHRAMTDLTKGEASREAVEAAIRNLMRAQLEGRPKTQRDAIGDVEAFIAPRLGAEATRVMAPWWRFFVSFDPATALSQVTCPALAVFGGRDTQVPPSLHRKPVEDALARNTRARVLEYPSANHLFQEAITGQVAEYQVLEKSFVSGLLEAVASWIMETTAVR